MKFGPIPVAEAEGAILAHATVAGERKLKKALRLTREDIADLQRAGVSEIIAAVLDTGDLSEDDAATTIANALLIEAVEIKAAATGRVNLHARAAGIFVVDRALIDAINQIDPAITIATVAEHARVEKGQMVATVKIIPFAVAGALVDRVKALATGRPAFSVKPFRPHKVGIVQTVLPGVKDSVLAKTVKITEQRLARSESRVIGERRTPHEAGAVSEAITALARDADMVVLFGASAMSDPDDVIPAAIRAAGGDVIRAGMPVDPGNLIALGTLDGKPVLGAPGCARSPKENGFDWVLDRLIAGIDVSAMDIAGMGVGGLLMEIPSRPQPREQAREAPVSVEAIVLAAGRSRRMGGPNKLLALFDGKPLVRRTAERVVASGAADTFVITGHQEDRIKAALAGLDIRTVSNRDFATGLASSLKAGIAALSSKTSGALIVLGDMPEITTADLDSLIAAFAKNGGHAVVRAVNNGKRGNPVILPRAVFPLVAQLEGDTGARHIVESTGLTVIDIEIGAGADIDVDTPEAMASAGGVLQG
ncbi:MAG TPA: molybdopterin-binding/glycosyltransferase family 2 protein [Rhizobiaceae bacterium]|nr:molybdopterin-binding/glycosyltransferase family 2 protein [Rhizobiaceae bacterium]